MTTLRKGDYAKALKLAERFNIKAGARPNRRVKAVLKEAVDFLTPLAGKVEKGAVVNVGSAWHGPDVFLDAATARKMARDKDRADYLTGSVDVTLPQRDDAKLWLIRKTFNLTSDKQAAGLALRVYEGVCDNLWRGNGFSMEKPVAQGKAQDLPLDVAKVKAVVVPDATP
jgi:hypothetical protein